MVSYVMGIQVFFLGLILLLLSVAAANAANHEILGTLRIGGVFPILSENDKLDVVGVMRMMGFLDAIVHINNKTDGYFDDILPHVNISFAIRDSRRTFTNAVLAALYLEKDSFNGKGVDAVIGAGDNDVSEALAAVFTGVDLVQVSYGASASELSHSDVYPDFLRVYPANSYQGTSMAHIVYDSFGWSRVVVFVSADPLGADTYSEFRSVSGDLGLTILLAAQFAPGLEDFSNFISQAKVFDPRIFVFFITDPADASNLIVQGYEKGLFHDMTCILASSSLAVPATWALPASMGTMKTMMKGFLAWSPMLNDWKTTETGIDFIRDFRARESTVTINADGSQTCHNGTDDDGNFDLYKVAIPDHPNITLCTGLNFKEYEAENTSTYMGFVHDATIAVLQGVHVLLETGQLSYADLAKSTKSTGAGISGRLLKKAIVHNVSFDGVTGKVAFSKGRVGSKTYGYGDRVKGVGFIANSIEITSTTTGVMRRFGRWTTEEGYTICDPSTPAYLDGCYALDYGTPGNIKPPDRRPDEIQSMPASLKGLMFALAAIIFCIASFLMALVFVIKRKTRLVKASQPMMIGFILAGVYLGAGRIALSGIDASTATCNAEIWLGHMAFTFVFFAMVLKTWRVHMIVNRGALKRVKITTMQIVMMTTASVCVMAFYLILYSAVGKPTMGYIEVELITGNVLLKPTCQTEVVIFDYVVYVLEGIALAVASYLCYATKDIPDAVNESKFVAMAVFTIIFVSVAGLPIVMSLPLDPYLKDLVVGFCFFIGLVAANGFYFGPKSYLLLTGADLNAQFQLVLKKNSKQMSKEQMADCLRKEDVHEDVADNMTREDFKKEVPKNCSVQYARTRALLWKELVAQLELQATVEKSGSSGHTGQSGAVACANPSTSARVVSVNHSADRNTMIHSEHAQGGEPQQTAMTRAVHRSSITSRQSSEHEVTGRQAVH